MAVLLLQHVARGALGTPPLASVVDMGVPPSVCHLPPARGVSGVSHATGLPLVIQKGRSLWSAVRMEEEQHGI